MTSPADPNHQTADPWGRNPQTADPWRPPPDRPEPVGGFLPPAGDVVPPAPPAGETASRALRVAVLITLLGAPAGLLWSRISPHPEVTRSAGSLNISHVESEVFLGADGSFLLLTGLLGVLTGAVMWWLRRADGVTATLGMAVGALAAAKVAQTVGQRVLVDGGLNRLCVAGGGCQLYDGTLFLRAPVVIVGWPLMALVTLLVLTAAFDRGEATVQRQSEWAYPAP